METRKKDFGQMRDGRMAKLYTMVNKNGMTVEVTDYGATIVSLLVPGDKGKMVDVLRGFDDVSGYENCTTYMGATVGRHVGQIKNARFSIGGKEYKLAVNDNDHNIHGGPDGFNKQLFELESFEPGKLVLKYLSKEGESGFPGNLDVRVTYTLNEYNIMGIQFNGISDADTILAMTNHAYFNLNGLGSASAMDNELKIYADKYTEVDHQGVPTGQILPVEGTPYDFRDFRTIGERVDEPHKELQFCKGYDHNWVILPEGDRSAMRIQCEMRSPATGVHMQLYANQPGLQMYSGNYQNGDIGKNGEAYPSRSSICLEPQVFPNGMDVEHFYSPVLKKGEEYVYVSEYRFI